TDGVTVTGFDRTEGQVHLRMVRDGEPENGALTLILDDRPLGLKQWMIVDAQGIETVVTLQSPRYGMVLEDDLFFLREVDHIRDATKAQPQ
ncbi:MAG: hypothetical protein OQJ99_04150, partial [Rhodospirillales bacterium]|nr:hypothetical protein [Rhodospirillales bacterium]